MNNNHGPRSLRCVASGLLCATGLLSGASSAVAKGEAELEHVRVCDSSACYSAWNVVDSDGDGIADADEIAAGSEPFDAESRTPLSVVVELIGVGLLPTYEFGVGQMIVFPAEFQAMLEQVESDPFAAFPLGDRKDAFKRAGIDANLLAEHGIDAEFGGFTLTLGSKDEGPPTIIGGLDIHLISADEAEAPSDTVLFSIEFGDGPVTHFLDNGTTVQTSNPMQPSIPSSKNPYTNPDADTGGVPTEEAFKAWERVRNATIRTVAGWTKIVGDPDDLHHDPHMTIILVDPDYTAMSAQISAPPRVGTAQPETMPDLFNPLLSGAGCHPKC